MINELSSASLVMPTENKLSGASLVVPMAIEFSCASLTRGRAIGGGGVKSRRRGGGRDGKRFTVGFCLRPESRVMLSQAFFFASRPGDSRGGGVFFFARLAVAAG